MAFDSAVDGLVRSHFPHPIASAWNEVQQGSGPDGRLRLALTLVEAVARTVVGLLIADYLRGPPDPTVTAALQKYRKPTLGTRWELIGQLTAALGRRLQPAPLFPESVTWWQDGFLGLPPVSGWWKELTAARNDEAHRPQSTDDEVREGDWEGWETRVEDLMRSLEWLKEYTIFRPGSVTPLENGVCKGEVISWRGSGWSRPRCSWKGVLVAERVYIGRVGHPIVDASAFFREGRSKELVVVDGIAKGRPEWGPAVPPSTCAAGFRSPDGEEVAWEVLRSTERAADRVEAGDLHGLNFDYPERFDVGREIGRGAYAVVHYAWDKVLKLPRALKFLLPERRADDEANGRFMLEAQLGARLHHAHISAPECHRYLGRQVLCMELAADGTLRNRLGKGPVPEVDLQDMAIQLLEGLAFAHAEKVVHRDIKPSNILVYGGNRLKIGDFGLAVVDDDHHLTKAGATPGTPAYLPPETEGSAAGDVFSLGRVLAELAAGMVGANVAQLPCSASVARLIASMCSPKPEDRPTASTALETWRAIVRRPVGERCVRDKKPAADLAVQLLGHLRCAAPFDAATLARMTGDHTAGASPARESLTRIERCWRRVHWPAMLSCCSLADLLAVQGVRWRRQRLTKLAGDAKVDLADIPARRLGLRQVLSAVQKRASYINETLLAEVVVRALGGDGRPGAPASELWDLSSALLKEEGYRRVVIPKRTGGRRHLHIPTRALGAAQHEVALLIGDAYRADPAVTGFVWRRSPSLHAWHHAGARVAIVVDIKDFFGHVTPWHLRHEFGVSSLAPALFRGWSEAGRQSLTEICFQQLSQGCRVLPQGSPTSPILANLAARPLDSRILQLCRETFTGLPWAYSRYADDLVISLGIDPKEYCEVAFETSALSVLETALAESDWQASPKKTRLWWAGGERLILCGIKVPEERDGMIGISREAKRTLRAAINSLSSPDPQLTNRARGFIAWAWGATGNLGLLALISSTARRDLGVVAASLGVSEDEFITACTKLSTGAGADRPARG